jgi:hypothetical protein
MFSNLLSRHEKPADLEDFYFDRTTQSEELASALSRGRHVLVYGLPRQGKSTLVRRVLASREDAGKNQSVTLHASKDFGFADIARNFLLALGCSVVAEQTRRKALGGKAELQLKWPFVSATAGGSADTSTQETYRTFTAELSDPNDVCHLLREMANIPILVVERFEDLKSKDRQRFIDFLQVCAETRVLQVVLVASSLEIPLEYRERIDLARYLTIIHLPPLSETENNLLVPQAFGALGHSAPLAIAERIFQAFNGSVEATVDMCGFIASQYKVPSSPLADEAAPTTLELVSTEFREQARNGYLALMAAIIEENLEISCARSSARTPAPAAAEPAGEGVTVASEADASDDADEAAAPSVPILENLAADPVFIELQTALQEIAHDSPLDDLPPATRKQLRSIYNNANRLGLALLQCEVESEALRLLAFALAKVVAGPTGNVDETYAPAYSTETYDVNLGVLLCEILAKSDLAQPVVLDDEAIRAYLRDEGLVTTETRVDDTGRTVPRPIVRRFSKRLRKLQRTLRIDPPIIAINKDRTSMSIWSAEDAAIMGDIKPDLTQLLDDVDAESDLFI